MIGGVGYDGLKGLGPLDGDAGKGATEVGSFGSFRYYTEAKMDGFDGEEGKVGLDGADGTVRPPFTDLIVFFPSGGARGTTGGNGGGGGGGSGGGMQTGFEVNDGAGSGGGGGGSGALGGSGGEGAEGGGGSFGIYTFDNGPGSQIINCTIEVSEPAKAGLSGEGGRGGIGGSGAWGGWSCGGAQVGYGGFGGDGGDGGKGGNGGAALDGISEKIINNGNSIEIIDNYSPVPMTITCAENIIVACDVDLLLEQPQLSEPCFPGTITNNAPEDFPLGITTVTWSVEDYYGNLLTCDQNVTVLDSVSPEIQCNSMNIYLNREGSYFLSDANLIELSAGTTDNCTESSEIKIYARPVSFYCDDVGEVKVDLVAQDKAGNRSYCRTIVNVIDTNSLSIDPINNILVELDSGVCETQITYPEIFANGCATLSQTNGLGADGLFPVGTTVETWKASNSYGDSLLLSFNVVVTVVNSAPAIDAVAAVEADENSNLVNVPLTGISFGADCVEQEVIINAKAQTRDLVSSLTVNYTSPETMGSLDIALIQDSFGQDTITVIVTDSEGAKDSVEFELTINPVNKQPTIDAVAGLEIEEDSPVISIPLSGISYGNDLDEQAVTISAVGINPALVNNIIVNYSSPDSTGSIDLSLTPDGFGEETITVTVTDSVGAFVSTSFVLNVTPVNDAPYLVLPLPDGNVNASNPFELSLTALMGVVFDDIDDDMLDFEVKQVGTDGLPLWATIESNVLNASPMTADIGTYSFVVTATDAEGAIATDNFKLVVEGYPTAIGDFDEGVYDVSMYPNPSKGEVNLKINSSEISDAEVVVRNIIGSEVFRKVYKVSEEIKIDLSNQVSGIYLITLQQGSNSVIKKLVLDRK